VSYRFETSAPNQRVVARMVVDLGNQGIEANPSEELARRHNTLIERECVDGVAVAACIHRIVRFRASEPDDLFLFLRCYQHPTRIRIERGPLIW
jgi:hypothetical protein